LNGESLFLTFPRFIYLGFYLYYSFQSVVHDDIFENVSVVTMTGIGSTEWLHQIVL